MKLGWKQLVHVCVFALFVVPGTVTANWTTYTEGPLCYPLGFLVTPFGLCDAVADVPDLPDVDRNVVPPPPPTEFESLVVSDTIPVPQASTAVVERVIERIVEQPIITNEYITVEGGAATQTITEADLAAVYAYIDALVLTEQSGMDSESSPVSLTTARAYLSEFVTSTFLDRQVDAIYDSLDDAVDGEVDDLRTELTELISSSTVPNLWTESGSDISYDSGNVGVGTTTPNYTVTVDGTLGLTGALYDNSYTAGTNGQILQTTGSGVQWVATSTLGLGGSGGGTVNSVAASVPTGWSVTGSPITNTGTLAFNYAPGYAAVLTASTTQWNNLLSTAITSTAGNWTGTFDGQEGSYYLDLANSSGVLASTSLAAEILVVSELDTETELESLLIGVSNVFTNNDGALTDDDLSNNTTTDLTEGTNLYWTNNRFDTRLSATTSLPSLTTLANLASVGTITSGVWQGTAIADTFLTKTGNWTGTFDGQEGSYYLDADNLTNLDASDLALQNGFVFRGGAGNTAEATSTLFIADNGFVGIGTSTPENLLHVYGSTGRIRLEDTDSDARIQLFNSSLTPTVNTELGRLAFQGNNSAGVKTNYASISGFVTDDTDAAEDGYLAFIVSNAGDNLYEAARITSDGNIGIGTTTPSAQLTVADTVQFASLTSGLLRTDAVGNVGTSTVGVADLASADFGSFTCNGTTCLFDNDEGYITATLTTEEVQDAAGLLVNGTESLIAVTYDDLNNEFDFVVDGDLSNYNNDAGFLTSVAPSDLVLTTGYVFRGGVSNTAEATSTLFIADSGGVGIGTTTPSEKLQIAAGSLLLDNTFSISSYDNAGAKNELLKLTGANNLVHGGGASVATQTFFTGGTEAMRIDENGNVGIGTTTPTENLHIYATADTKAIIESTTNNAAFILRNTSSLAPDELIGTVNFGGTDSAGNFDNYAQVQGFALATTSGSEEGYLTFRTRQSSGFVTEVMRLDQNGNVGIGTTNPTTLLTVSADTGDAGLTLIADADNNSDNDTAYLSLIQDAGATSALFGLTSLADTSPLGETYTDALANSLVLGTEGSSAVQLGTNSAVAMTIDGSGNVGIGTTTPSQRLSVTGGSIELTDNNADLIFSGNNAEIQANGSGNLNLNTALGVVVGLDYDNNNAGQQNFVIQHNGGTELFRVEDTGNVGIGTSSPAATLTVAGSTADGGILVYDSSTSNASPVVEVRGRRSDGNASQSFSGGLALSHLRTDAAINDSKKLGTIYFGGNHTDGTESNLLYSASISGVSEGTFSDSTTMPSALAFYTGSTGRTLDTANQTFGTERMRIDADGNVGIGTTDPNAPLQVNGSIFGGRTTEQYLSLTGDASGNYLTGVSQSGNAKPLFVEADANSGALVMRTLTSSALQFRTNDTTMFFIEPGSAEAMRIDADGNVGIGTDTPLYTLDVFGDGRFVSSAAGIVDALVLDNNQTAATNNGTALVFQANRGVSADQEYARIQAIATDIAAGASDGALQFFTNNNNVSAERMRIDSSGNVGIGTTTPQSAFTFRGGNSLGNILSDYAFDAEVEGGAFGTLSAQGIRLIAGSNTSNLTAGTAGDGGGIILTAGDGGTGSEAGTPGNAGDVIINGGSGQNATRDGDVILANLQGNVGIGTTALTSELTVAGDIRVGTSGTNGCIERFGGGVLAGTCSSDAQLKDNVVAIGSVQEDVLENLLALIPVTYNWNQEASDRYYKDTDTTNIGLIAQNVEAAFPELVSENDDGYKQVDFSALPYYIIEAMRDLWEVVSGNQEKIDTLELRIEALEAELSVPNEPSTESDDSNEDDDKQSTGGGSGDADQSDTSDDTNASSTPQIDDTVASSTSTASSTDGDTDEVASEDETDTQSNEEQETVDAESTEEETPADKSTSTEEVVEDSAPEEVEELVVEESATQ